MNELSKYIKWIEIWNNDVLCQFNVIDLELYDNDTRRNMQYFREETRLSIDLNQCEIQGDEILFQFSETGGKNESDTQGWYRSYWFRVDPSQDFLITDSGYEQG